MKKCSIYCLEGRHPCWDSAPVSCEGNEHSSLREQIRTFCFENNTLLNLNRYLFFHLMGLWAVQHHYFQSDGYILPPYFHLGGKEDSHPRQGKNCLERKAVMVKTMCLMVLGRISDQKVPKVPPMNRQLTAWAFMYKKGDSGTSFCSAWSGAGGSTRVPAPSLGCRWRCCSGVLPPLCIGRVYGVGKR